MFKDNNGRNIFAITLNSDNRVIGKIKEGKGDEIIYCSQNACDVNCEMFKSSFYATDIYGTKSYFEPLAY